MAIETHKFVQSAKNVGTNAFTGSISVTLPAVATSGNLLLLMLATDKNAVSATLPSGFVVINSQITGPNSGGVLAYKVSDGTEQTLTCSIGTSSVSKPNLMVFELDGFTGTPLDVSGVSNSGATDVSSQATASITTTVANTTVFAFAVIDSGVTGFSGSRTWSNSFDEFEAGGFGAGAELSCAKRTLTSAGAVSTTFSWTAGTADQVATFIVAFKEDGSTFNTSQPTYTSAQLVQEFGAAAASAATSIAIRLPRTPVSGNLLVVNLSVGVAPGTITPPTGFTIIKSFTTTGTHGGCIAYKVSDGTERNFTFSWANSGFAAASVLEYAGVAASPLGAYSRVQQTTASNTITIPTISTTSSKSVVIASVMCDQLVNADSFGAGTFSNSFTGISKAGDNTTGAGAIMVASKVVSAAATSTSSTFTFTAATNQPLIAFIVEFGSADGTGVTATDAESSGTVATPTFSPAAGTFTSAQSVTISTTTSGATIYYTLDGSTPTTSSTQYTAPISVSSTTTIKAFAKFTGMTDSAVATATYTINASSSAPVIVQQAEAVASAFTGTITATFASGVTAGNMIFVAASVDKNPGSISLPAGFTKVQSYETGPAAGGVIGYKIATGGETSVTVTMGTTTVSKPSIIILEISGIDTVNTLGVSSKNTSNTTLVQSLSPGAITTTLTNPFVIAVACQDSWATGWDSGTFSGGFTMVNYAGAATPTSGIASTAVGTLSTTTGTVVNTTFTTTAVADEMVAFIVEFGSTGSGGGTGTPTQTTVSWQVSGAVTHSSAQVLLATATSASLSMNVYQLPGNTLIYTAPSGSTTAEGTNNLIKFNISGLSPNTQYRYIPKDFAEISGASGVFQTFPYGSGSFKFCHWSCNETGANPRFADIQAKSPLFMLGLGDWHYTDTNSATESAYHSSYTNNYTAQYQSTLYKSIPMDRIWDDHDFAGNGSTSVSVGKTASASVFRKFTPTYPLPDPNNVALYHSFVCGRLRFVFMDVRSESVTSGAIMTTTQMNWVKRELKAAKDAGQAVCLVSGVPWISSETASDNWGSTSFQAQRQELATYIRQIQMSKSLFLIHGDAHMLAWDNGTNNTYGVGGGINFRVFGAAALGRTGSVKGGPYSGGSQGASGQYAEVTVTDNGTYLTITWIGRQANDTAWATVVFNLNLPTRVKQRVIVM